MIALILLFLNIGTSELVLIFFVALLLFGGEKLPELARGLGKGIRDFKDASEGVKREINNQINSYEEKTTTGQVGSSLVTEKTEDANTETHPLIDITPVAGTVPLGESHAVAEDHSTENHTGAAHVGTPAEPGKTTHE